MSFHPSLVVIATVGMLYAASSVNEALRNATDIENPDVMIDKESSERLRKQVGLLFEKEKSMESLRKSTVMLLAEKRQEPYLFGKSGGMVHCLDHSSGRYVVTVPSDMPSVEVGFDENGSALARVPKRIGRKDINSIFPLLLQSFKTLGKACEMQSALAAEFGNETYPLYSGLSDVVFSSKVLSQVYFRASFDLSGKISKISSYHATLATRSPKEVASLAHETIKSGMRAI